MNISYQWLSELVDLESAGKGLEDVVGALNQIGLAVEGIENCSDDSVIDIDVTSNRPDCLNHIGVAREVAARFGLRLNPPDDSSPAGESAEYYPAVVEIDDPELCPRYTARLLRGVQLGESPEWLKARLEALGHRPISNVVDITNYVMLELGQPLHAFDYDRLKDHRIVVRRARTGEKLTTLDGQERQLDGQMLMICDGAGPVAVGGVMGGGASEISDSTRTIFLESAYFNPRSVRRTSKQLGLSTEASYRFERGSDPGLPDRGLNRATRLILEIAGGQALGEVIDVFPGREATRSVDLSPCRIQQVTGIEMDSDQVESTLTSLGFGVAQTDSGWSVQIPGFRPDVSIQDDLVEEVLRHYGYDRLPSRYPASSTRGDFLPHDRRERTILDCLTGAGFFEAVTLAFNLPSTDELFFGEARELIPLANALSETETHLRRSLIPGLVQVVRHNHNHHEPDVRLFELGRVYEPGEKYLEHSRLGLVATGSYYFPYWSQQGEEFRFAHLKGLLDQLADGMQVKFDYSPCDKYAFLHPGIAAEVLLDGDSIGCVGEFHPRLMDHFKFQWPLLLAELDLELLFRRPLKDTVYRAPSRFPRVHRDLSFLVDSRVEFATIDNAIKALNIPDLRDIQLIDLYQGPRLPKGQISLAVRLVFANSERTLIQEEVSHHCEQVYEELQRVVNAEIRS